MIFIYTDHFQKPITASYFQNPHMGRQTCDYNHTSVMIVMVTFHDSVEQDHLRSPTLVCIEIFTSSAVIQVSGDEIA